MIVDDNRGRGREREMQKERPTNPLNELCDGACQQILNREIEEREEIV